MALNDKEVVLPRRKLVARVKDDLDGLIDGTQNMRAFCISGR